MNAPASITITPILVADLLAEGEPMPLYVHVIGHPDAELGWSVMPGYPSVPFA